MLLFAIGQEPVKNRTYGILEQLQRQVVHWPILSKILLVDFRWALVDIACGKSA